MIINNFKLTSYFLQTKTQYKTINKNMLSTNIYDTISFEGLSEKNHMLNYYNKIMKNYIPSSVEEKAFSESLSECLRTDINTTQFSNIKQNFLSNYYTIEDKLLDKENVSNELRYVFSALIEGLDNSKTKEQSRLFTKVLLDFFLDTFAGNQTIQDDIKYYSTSKLLKRPIIIDLIQSYNKD